MTSESGRDATSAMVAFVGLYDTEDGEGKLGAAMVTNARGFPMEFRVATAVRPTPVQRALYGRSLAPFVESELIAKTLISELKRHPSVVLVNQMRVLDTQSSYPVVYVAAADTIVHSDASGLRYHSLEPGAIGDSPLGLVSADTADRFDEAAAAVADASRHFDPLECFDRMKLAISALAESDDRYR